MRPLLHASVLTATLSLAAYAATPSTSSDGSRRFSGTVQAVDNGCFVDGVCTATVDGIVVTTMSGERLNNPSGANRMRCLRSDSGLRSIA